MPPDAQGPPAGVCPPVHVEAGPDATTDAEQSVTSKSGRSYTMSNSGNHMKRQHHLEGILVNPHFRRGYLASALTMCLGIMGGSVLPVPWAFSITGIGAGIAISVVVAWTNVFTSDMLIRQCYKAQVAGYEDIAYATGGSVWRVITQISLVALLAGDIIGEMQQIGEASVIALRAIWGTEVPSWLVYQDSTGEVPMVVLTLLVAFPFCMMTQMRSLEYVGYVGFVIIMWLTIVVVAQSIGAGLPAIGDGEFHPSGFTSLASFSDAVSVLGFAFYVQPVMMPLLAEMPGHSRHQARILSWAMRFTIIAFAGGVYGLVGFFGAANFGNRTSGNILENKLSGGGVAQGMLNFFMAIYLTITVPALEFPMRQILKNWLPGDPNHRPHLKRIALSTGTLLICLVVACFWHSGSNKLLVLTGATGVLMCSYVCPIVNHFFLYFGWARCQLEAEEAWKEAIESSQHSVPEGEVMSALVDSQAVPIGEALPPLGPFSLEEIGKPGILTYRKELKPGLLPLLSEGLFEIVLPLLIVIVGCVTGIVSLKSTFGPNIK